MGAGQPAAHRGGPPPSAGESRLTAAIPTDDPCCSCKRTRWPAVLQDAATPSCHLLGLLLNQTELPLTLLRVELIKGELRGAISLEAVPAGGRMCWSTTTSPAMQPKSMGNVGVVIFQVVMAYSCSPCGESLLHV